MKLVSLILPIYFQVGLSFPAPGHLGSYKHGVEYENLKQQGVLMTRHDVYKDILGELLARHVQKQVEKTRNLAKLLDKIQLLTYRRNQRKLHRRKKSTGCVDFACFDDRATKTPNATTTTTSPSPPSANPAKILTAIETSTESTTVSTEAQSKDILNILWSPFKLPEIVSILKAIFSKIKFQPFLF